MHTLLQFFDPQTQRSRILCQLSILLLSRQRTAAVVRQPVPQCVARNAKFACCFTDRVALLSHQFARLFSKRFVVTTLMSTHDARPLARPFYPASSAHFYWVRPQPALAANTGQAECCRPG